ncbi:DUF805 domain-containing protein [Bradyrhizobium amphicarpaeae]|uniref:DUF805 domain-containing protein n=1 Tax=Bradyrhizobium amphicarpaeae TaxID=1404768 RepID=UPI002FE6539D
MLWQALLIVALLAGLLWLIGQVIHILNAEGSSKLSIKLDFDFGLDDIFKLVDPRAYRSLASLDRTDLILKSSRLAMFAWIFLATAIKRLHDRDRSGWWMIPFFLMPGLFSQFSDLLPDGNWTLALSLTASTLWLWGLVEMFIVPGTSGENRFGPDPLAEVEDGSASASSPAKSWDQQSELELVPPSASPPGGMHVNRGA